MFVYLVLSLKKYIGWQKITSKCSRQIFMTVDSRNTLVVKIIYLWSVISKSTEKPKHFVNSSMYMSILFIYQRDNSLQFINK